MGNRLAVDSGKTKQGLVVQGGDRSNESSQHITKPTDFQGCGAAGDWQPPRVRCRRGLATSKLSVDTFTSNHHDHNKHRRKQRHGGSGRWVSSKTTSSTAKQASTKATT